MYISLPSGASNSNNGGGNGNSQCQNSRRRPPLTPASGAPPYVSTSCSSVVQCERSNSSRSATAILSRVASSPGSPTMSAASTALPTPSSMPSIGSSPASTPGGSNQFPFSLQKQLYELYDAPEGQYVSFPSFDDTYGDSGDDDDQKK